MRGSTVFALFGVGLMAMSVSACGGARQALGLTKVSPDEFRVVTKAPLVLPPDYALRPPEPGKPRPQEQATDSAARLALLGSDPSRPRTLGESLLIRKAGGERVDPSIRFVVDEENGNLAYKPTSFANTLLFFNRDAGGSDPLQPDAEARRIQREAITSTTGNGQVIIQKSRPAGFKLPGL